MNNSNNNQRILFGLVVAAAGVLLILERLNLIAVPSFLFTWPMILILLGAFTAAKEGITNTGALILLGIGVFFLSKNIFELPYIVRTLFWPGLLVVLGLSIAFKPKKHGRRHGFGSANFLGDDDVNQQDVELLDVVAIMGGSKRRVQAKNFKGGKITAIMGGADVNLHHVQLQGVATLDITAIAGGIKLVVPPHWKITTQVTTFAGAIEDKRYLPLNETSELELVLTGSIVAGGVEITSIV